MKRFLTPPAMNRHLITAGALALLSGTATAQSAGVLRGTLVGRKVVMKIAMPATFRGVDLRVGTNEFIDTAEVLARHEKYGTSMVAGDVVTITDVVVKGDLIELHVNGGGAGRFSGKSSLPANVPMPVTGRPAQNDSSMSSTGGRAVRAAQQERARQGNERARAKEAASQASRLQATGSSENEKELERMKHGSRFNIRYQSALTADELKVAEVMKLLQEFVDFRPTGLLNSRNP